MRSSRVFAIGLLVLASACSLRDAACGRPAPEVVQVPDQPSATAPVDPAVGAQVHIVFLGDSLTAGLGLLAQQAYPQVDCGHVREGGLPRGAGQRRHVRRHDGRRPAARRTAPQRLDKILVLALGANDALRGLTTQQTHDNLAQIIDAALARGVFVLLCGMEAPTNLGEDYRESFRNVYINLCASIRAGFVSCRSCSRAWPAIPRSTRPTASIPTRKARRSSRRRFYPKLRDLVDRIG